MNWCSTHGVNFKREKTCSLCTRDMRNEALREAAVIADDYSYEAAVAILAKLAEAEGGANVQSPNGPHFEQEAGEHRAAQQVTSAPACGCDSSQGIVCDAHDSIMHDAEKCLLRSADEKPSAEQPTRHFSAKQIQDVFESYWSGTSSMSTKAAQFVADKLNTLLDAPAEQRLRELTEDEVMSAINYWRGYNGTLTGATAMLNALVKKYGERG